MTSVALQSAGQPRFAVRDVRLNGAVLPVRPQAPVNFFPTVAAKLRTELVASGRWQDNDFIPLGIGDCTIKLPQSILEAHGRYLRTHGDSPYTPIAGLQNVRAGLAQIFGRVLDVGVAPENVMVIPGSRTGVDIAIRALSRQFPNLKVLVAAPTWATYADNAWRACNVDGRLVTHELPKHDTLGFSPLNADILDRMLTNDRSINCVIIVNPHNPLGYVMNRPEAIEVAAVLAKHSKDRNDLFVLEDATYWPMVYGPDKYYSLMTAAFEHSDATRDTLLSRFMLIMGLQKVSMSGERISSFVVPDKRIADALLTELTAATGATNRSAQELALAVYSDSAFLGHVVEELSARRFLLAKNILSANLLFQQGLAAQRGVSPESVPALIEAHSLADVATNAQAPGGGFYTMARFSQAAIDLVPLNFRGEDGSVNQDTLLRFLISEAGMVVQPAATTLLTDPSVVRVSYGAASADQIAQLPRRLVDAFLGSSV